MSSHRPQKKWGQNFLINTGAIEKIVAAVEPLPGELVLEIGPGRGALTRHLVERYDRVRALEIDPVLAESLASALPELEVRLEDATSAELPDEPYVAVGNLPYNVATPIIRRLAAHPLMRKGVFMVQKEVADRIAAKAGSDAYGWFSLAVQAYGRVRPLLTLGPGSFRPRPKVSSAVIVFERETRPFITNEEDTLEVASQAFTLRRKTLLNAIAGGRDREAARAAIESTGIDPQLRPEQLTLEDFDRLTAALRSREPHE